MNSSERTKLWVESHKKVCPVCGNSMYYRSKTCKNCSQNYLKSEKIKLMSLGDYRDKLRKRGVHPSWINAEIRNFARSWNKQLKNLGCEKCGYALHVEFCHRTPLSELPDSVTLGEANSQSNLIVLCPNCHWEFDNGI